MVFLCPPGSRWGPGYSTECVSGDLVRFWRAVLCVVRLLEALPVRWVSCASGPSWVLVHTRPRCYCSLVCLVPLVPLALAGHGFLPCRCCQVSCVDTFSLLCFIFEHSFSWPALGPFCRWMCPPRIRSGLVWCCFFLLCYRWVTGRARSSLSALSLGAAYGSVFPAPSRVLAVFAILWGGAAFLGSRSVLGRLVPQLAVFLVWPSVGHSFCLSGVCPSLAALISVSGWVPGGGSCASSSGLLAGRCPLFLLLSPGLVWPGLRILPAGGARLGSPLWAGCAVSCADFDSFLHCPWFWLSRCGLVGPVSVSCFIRFWVVARAFH